MEITRSAFKALWSFISVGINGDRCFDAENAERGFDAFNERFENLVQFVTSGCQGLFFVTLALTPLFDDEGNPGKPNGAMMTQINLAGMGVVMVASIKAQVSGMQKKFMKMRKKYVITLKIIRKNWIC